MVNMVTTTRATPMHLLTHLTERVLVADKTLDGLPVTLMVVVRLPKFATP